MRKGWGSAEFLDFSLPFFLFCLSLKPTHKCSLVQDSGWVLFGHSNCLETLGQDRRTLEVYLLNVPDSSEIDNQD